MRKKKTTPKSNVLVFSGRDSKPVINSLKAAFLPPSRKNGTIYFLIPKELSAVFGSTSEVLARGEYVDIKRGDLTIFTLEGGPYILGRPFKLFGEWAMRDENDRSRIYYWAELRNARKLTQYAACDMADHQAAKEILTGLIPPAKKTARRRREFPHLTPEEIRFFDSASVLDKAV